MPGLQIRCGSPGFNGVTGTMVKEKEFARGGNVVVKKTHENMLFV